ncbi:MAG: copper homeostasis protein CutC [Rhodothermales bacterium]|nr:copper homeostasis protein CutC [Rhodothermales bacterium]
MITLEVCIDSVESALAATEAGADRLELNAALELGGLTPSPGLVAEVLAVTTLPVIAMLRPRAGDFVYSDDEFRVIRRDAEALLTAGVAGLAFGFLDEFGNIDRHRTYAITAVMNGKESVFHRAFDLVPSLHFALEEVIDLGIWRVLTSGGAETAIAGIPQLSRLNAQAVDRIEILAGAGIKASNVRRLVDGAGCKQVHGTFRGPGAYTGSPGASDATGLSAFRAPASPGASVDEIRAVRKALS